MDENTTKVLLAFIAMLGSIAGYYFGVKTGVRISERNHNGTIHNGRTDGKISNSGRDME